MRRDTSLARGFRSRRGEGLPRRCETAVARQPPVRRPRPAALRFRGGALASSQMPLDDIFAGSSRAGVTGTLESSSPVAARAAVKRPWALARLHQPPHSRGCSRSMASPSQQETLQARLGSAALLAA